MWKAAIIIALLAGVLALPMMSLLQMGIGLRYHKQHPGKCTAIKKYGVGAEDFQILSSGMAFLTSGVHLDMTDPKFKKYCIEHGGGSLQLLDMNNPTLGAKKLTIKNPGSEFDVNTFGPHGISVIEDPVKGEHIIYVINHVEEKPDRVEKFVFVPKTQEVRHVKSIFSDVFRVINDIQAISEDKLYISNWIYSRTQAMSIFEEMYQRHWGSIVYYDGTNAQIVAEGLRTPNGVMLSKDKRMLYVALSSPGKVLVYKRGKSNTDLQLMQEADIQSPLDNIHLSERGDALYIGCHPIAYKIFAHLTDPANFKAPSKIVRVPLKDGLIAEEDISQVFYDHGDLIAGSATGAVYKNKLLVGSVIDTLVMCDLTDNSIY